MFVKFDVDRCIEATGVLFSITETKMMSRMRLLKLLYLANRRSLKETGDPIVDDDAFAMKDGPVLSHTYDLIKGVEQDEKAQSMWNERFKVVDRILIQMLSNPGSDHLSDYDVETLVDIASEWNEYGDYDISELTHTFDEYKRHWNGAVPSERISEIDLLQGIGFTREESLALLKEAGVYAIEKNVLPCR